MEQQEKYKVKGFGLKFHMSGEKVNSALYSGTIEAPETPLHGKTIVQECHTKKTKKGNFGKSDTVFYLQEKDSPMFKSVEELVNHYNNQPK